MQVAIPGGSIVGVSKTRSAEDIRSAMAAGLTHFGENYVRRRGKN